MRSIAHTVRQGSYLSFWGEAEKSRRSTRPRMSNTSSSNDACHAQRLYRKDYRPHLSFWGEAEESRRRWRCHFLRWRVLNFIAKLNFLIITTRECRTHPLLTTRVCLIFPLHTARVCLIFPLHTTCKRLIFPLLTSPTANVYPSARF